MILNFWLVYGHVEYSKGAINCLYEYFMEDSLEHEKNQIQEEKYQSDFGKNPHLYEKIQQMKKIHNNQS